MSAPVISVPPCPVDREQAITDIIESIALEETGLAHIINAEGEKIQKGIALSTSVSQLISINDSVNDTLNTMIHLQMLLHAKLDTASKL